MKSFTKWILSEKTDIFGFERYPDKRKQNPLDDKPIIPLNTEVILGELSKLNLGVKQASWNWSDLIEWGGGLPGSVQAYISPLGAYKTILRKKITDLLGDEVWICKQVFSFENTDDEKNEQAWISTIYLKLQEIDGQMEEMPIREWKGLEKFVYSLTSKIRMNMPDIFIFEGINRLNENNYLIYMSLRGSGVEAPTARRVEQFNINLSYYPDAGLLRCWGNDVSSPTNQHLWQLRPSRWDEYFSPAQSREEIETAITLILKGAF